MHSLQATVQRLEDDRDDARDDARAEADRQRERAVKAESRPGSA